MQYWFNTRTGQVEDDTNSSPKKDLLGPYPTREAAAAALQSTHERTEQIEAEEEAERRRRALEEGRDPDEDEPGIFG